MSQPEDFACDDIPAAVAPFAAADLRRATSAALALHVAAGPYAIAFDRLAGVLTFEREGASFSLFPFMLLREGADRRRALAPFPEERREEIAIAILQLWKVLVDELYGLVAMGCMKAVVREDSPKARTLTVLPEGAFALFEIVDWEHGIGKCKYTGEMIYNLHFREGYEKQEIVSVRQDGAVEQRERKRGAKTDAVLKAVEALWAGNVPSHLTGAERNKKIIDWSRANGGTKTIDVRQIQRALASRKLTSGDK